MVDLPWGDGHTPTGSNGDQHDYALMDRDPEDANEHAGFRNYSTVMGRWLSPDPYYGSYDFSNPHTLNRYAYALNNPMSLIDPSGLDDCQPTEGGYVCDGGDNGNGDGSGNGDPGSGNGDSGSGDPNDGNYRITGSTGYYCLYLCSTTGYYPGGSLSGPGFFMYANAPNPFVMAGLIGLVGGSSVVAPNKPSTIDQTNQVLAKCSQAGASAASPYAKKAMTPPNVGDIVGGGILAAIANYSNPWKLAIGIAGTFKSQIGNAIVGAFVYSAAQTGCLEANGINTTIQY